MGLDLDSVKTIIKNGMKWRNTGKTNKWHAHMHGYEVVFEELENILYVITVYPAEAQK